MAGAGAMFSMDMGTMRRSIRRAARRIRDVRSAGEEIGEMLVASTVERFETSRAPDGTTWEPSKRAEAEGGKTLVDNGILRNSIGKEVSSLAVVVGSNEVYARPHNEGAEFSVVSTRRTVKLPQRQFVGFSAEDIEEAQAILLDHIRKGFRG